MKYLKKFNEAIETDGAIYQTDISDDNINVNETFILDKEINYKLYSSSPRLSYGLSITS